MLAPPLANGPVPGALAHLDHPCQAFTVRETGPSTEQFDSLPERAQRLVAERSLPGDAQGLADAVAEIGLDEEAVAAAWLIGAEPPSAPCQETHSPDSISLDAIREHLGDGVAALVDGVRRVTALQWQSLQSEQAEALRKAFLALAQDIRSVILALAQRLEQLRAKLDDSASDPEEVRTFAQESLDVHATLANRLGVWQLKWPLEDTAFRLLEPDTYAELKRLIATKRQHREAFVAQIVQELHARMAGEGLTGKVSGRPKHIYSVVRKMRRKQVSFEEVFDLTAVRIIVSKVRDCYALLGLVHSLWVPIPHQMDDYIAMPKPNGYQSLHTAVIGPEGRAVEIQIRTEEMHQFAEYGVAAHWAYKEGRSRNDLSRRFTLVRQLLELEQSSSSKGPDPETQEGEPLADSLHGILFTDQVYVFTPQGKIIELAAGATPLDFAYRIHTEVGHRCKGARVNDQIAPLTSQLSTGDRVEILTQRIASPSRDWMSASRGFLTSARARGHVRSWFRTQEADEAKTGKSHLATTTLSASQHSPTIEPEHELNIPVQPLGENLRPARGIVLDNVDDILGRRAQCCSPLPGDDVVGFITRGRGLTLHRKDCAQLDSHREPERLVEVSWGSDRHSAHRVSLSLTLQDHSRSFSQLVEYLSKIGEHLASAAQQAAPAGELRWTIEVHVKDAQHEQRLVKQLSTLRSVLSVHPRRD